MNTNEIINHIVKWLNNYVTQSNQNGFIIGVSGGIDSAITSTLAAKTGKPVLVLNMPIHQAPDQLDRAQEHVDWLKRNYTNVNSILVDLTHSFNELIKSYPLEGTQENLKLAEANTRSRIRMITLYFYATTHKYLVTGTGNKVEDFGVGFYTKYGDGGVDISPIADLYKTQVFALAKELGIIDSIQQAQPIDGLWEDNRSDEDQIGATYAELEWAMSMDRKYKEGELTIRQKEVYAIYYRLNKAAQHKINPIPVCLIPSE